MRWITFPLVAAAVGGAALSVPAGRSALVSAAVISPLATAEAPVALEAPVSEDSAGAAPAVESPAEVEPAEEAAPEQPPTTEPPATESPTTEPPATELPPVEEPPAPPPAADPTAPPAAPPATEQPSAVQPPTEATAPQVPVEAGVTPAGPRPATGTANADVAPHTIAGRHPDAALLSGFEAGSVDALGGMSPVAADAYLGAARWAQANLPSCDLDASFLAGIGQIESQHGTPGGIELLRDGGTSEPIRDELGGQGPMHFTASEWARFGSDGNGDGVKSPDNMFDATVAAARKLCELAQEMPGASGTLASATDRHRVAYAFDQGAAAKYVVDPHDAIHGDDYAAEAIRFAESITAKLSSYGQALEGADRRIAQVVTWMRQQIQTGARYAATNPGRFGTAWDGVPKRSFISGRTYQYPAGTITYDCSGLMVVGFRQIGVDLVKLGAGWTGSMLANLPRVPRDQMQVGDLIILGRGGRTTHVVMYLGQDRYIHAGSCGSTMGVCEREGIDWSRVMGVARVPLDHPAHRDDPRPAAATTSGPSSPSVTASASA